MSRKKKHPAHENHERWLVSYADFITLMFAFFVVMFANAQTDKSKARQISEAVKQALEGDRLAAKVAALLGGTVDEKGSGNAQRNGPGGAEKSGPETQKPQTVPLEDNLRRLTSDLQKEIVKGDLNVTLEARGLVISLRQAAFFPSGEDTIDPATYSTIGKVAEAIRRVPNPVRLEGHTDSVPIHNGRFRSNWELSAARSIRMLELFSGEFDLPEERLAVVGYAETAPVDTNESDDGRAHNRRVDIVILTKEGIGGEPARASGTRNGGPTTPPVSLQGGAVAAGGTAH